jgi:hypothetical protein
MTLTTFSSSLKKTKEMMRNTQDEIRLNSLRLLAKMIASAYLKQTCPKSGSELGVGEDKASCRDKWCVGYSRVTPAGQGSADEKGN